MFEKFKLNNQFALITGAGGLLGYQHARALLECGAKVVLTDINLKSLEKNFKLLKKDFKHDKVLKIKMNVVNEKSIINCKKVLINKKIFISILINNASYNPKLNKLKSQSFENFSLKKWNREINVGLTGAFLCSKIFGSEMAYYKKGVILNISSDLSIISPDHRIYNNNKNFKKIKPITYSVTKTGLIGLTRYLATYWASKNIRCNAISPAGVYDGQNKEFVNRIKKLIPLNRMARKDEYKSAIQFLCSDASSYMTGQNLIIDGGRSVW